MLGPRHAASGAVAFAAAAPYLHPTGAGLIAGVILTAGAALDPDLDEHGSTISSEGGFLTEGLSQVVHRAGGGHRKLTHSLLGAVIFTATAELLVMDQHSIYARAGLVLYAGLLGGAALHALNPRRRRARHRGHYRDLAALAAGGVAVFAFHVNLSPMPWCIAIGVLAHIAGDMLTHDGCPLLFPVCRRDFALLPHPLRITAGKFTEHWIVGPALAVALVILVARDAAALETAHRLLLI